MAEVNQMARGRVVSTIDLEARNMAQKALDGISSHERVCTERWREVRLIMADIKRILGWGITGLIGSMGTLIAWLATHPGHY